MPRLLNKFFLLSFLVSLSAQAYDTKQVTVKSDETPAAMQGVGVTEKTGSQLDMSLPFVNDKGEAVTLGAYFNKSKPVLMTMVYYNCPGLCNFHLNGLNDTFNDMKAWEAGKEFEFVVVSMDHTENSELAAEKKQAYLEDYGKNLKGQGWHFLTGTKQNVDKLADQFGFRFKKVEETGEFAHAASAYIVTDKGVISRYLHGIMFSGSTLKLSLVEASRGKIGSLIDQALLFCYQFNPGKNKYTLYAYNIMRLGGFLTILILGLFLGLMWRKHETLKPL